MSHVETVTTEIRHLNALKEAARELGGEFEAATTYEWFGFSVGDYPLPAGIAKEDLGKCDYKIRFPGIRYEIGVKQMPAGHFTLLYDFYSSPNNAKHDGRKLLERCGPKLGRLTDLYEHHAMRMNLKKCWKVDSIEAAARVSRITGHKIFYTGKLLTVSA